MMAGMHERFNSMLFNIMNTKKANSGFLTKERYDDLLKKVSNSKSKKSGKKSVDYQRLKRYDVMKVGDVEKLIFPVSKDTSNIRFYVYFEELFTIIHETHLLIGHGGRNRMLKELQKKYKNITTEEVMLYLNLCESCQKKLNVTKKGLVVRPMVFQEMNARCQVNPSQNDPPPEVNFETPKGDEAAVPLIQTDILSKQEQDMSRRRIRRTRTMPIVPGPLNKHSSSGGRGDTERGNDNPFVHFLSPLSPSRPTMFEESPEEIFSMPDLSDRMGMEGRPTSPGKLEGSSNYLTCSPLISAMSGMHEDLMSGAGPSSSSQDTGESEGVQGDYDQDIDVKAEPEFSVEPEICEDESQNTNQSSCDRRSSQSSPAPAGMTGPYLLKKETHCATILDQLLRDDTFCDVTLTAEGQSLRAHKLVLCLASNYFRQVMSKESNIQNVIVFRDIRFMELKNLITFIYTGEATVDAAELESFMKTAEMLEVTSLCDGQRKLPKNLIPRSKEAETEKHKTTFAAKRALNSCVSPTPSKTRRIEETPVSRHQTKSVASHPSTSGNGGPFAPQVILSTSIKTEPSADEDRIDEEYHSFEQCQPSPPPLYHQDSETPSSGETGNDPGHFSDKVLVGKCPFCPNSEQVLQGIALTKHLSTYHPDKTVFCCENCSRAFLKKGAYEAHKHDCNR